MLESGHGGWAAIVACDGQLYVVSGRQSNTSPIEMELQAVLEGLKKVPLDLVEEATVYTDSLQILQAVQRGWLEQWQQRGWKTSKGKPVPGVPLWKALREILHKDVNLKFVHVKGHSGNPLNDFVDELAGKEAGRK